MSLLENKAVSDEKLNAYVDDELDFDEKRQVYEMLGAETELSRQVRELQRVRSLLQHAYQSPPLPPGRASVHRRRSGYLQGLAASLILGLGALLGWFSHQELGAVSYAVGEAPEKALSTTAGMDGRDIATASNVILHIDSADAHKLKAALDRTEQLLQSRRREGRDFHLEIIANKGGVELLRKDKSPFPQRVEALMAEYDNVSFMACANALRQLEELGVKVELLPGVRTDHAAIDKIIQRLEQGWSYLRV